MKKRQKKMNILLPNDGLIDQALAKDDALVSPLEALLDNGAGHADRGASHAPALVVEVAEDDVDALVLLAEEVLGGDLDVVEGDVGGAGGGGVRGLDGLRLDALAALDQEDAEALLGAHAGDEVVGVDAVRDPLLRTVDDVVLAVGGLGGGGAQAGDVGAREGLGDGQAHVLLAAEDLVHEGLLARLVLHVVHDAGQADDHAGELAVLEAARVGPHPLLRDDHVVEVVELLAAHDAAEEVDAVQVLAGPQAHVQDAGLGHAVHEVLADVLAVGLAGLGLGGDVLVVEDAHRLLQLPVALAVVRGLEGRREPEGLGVRHEREVAGLRRHHRRLLALDSADPEVLVLREHLVPVQVVEGRRRVLPGDLSEDRLAARVRVEEVAHIVYLAVDDEPDRVLRVMFGDLVAGECLRHGVCGLCEVGRGAFYFFFYFRWE